MIDGFLLVNGKDDYSTIAQCYEPKLWLVCFNSQAALNGSHPAKVMFNSLITLVA